MPKLLLIDNDHAHAERMLDKLRFRHIEVETCNEPQQAITRLRRSGVDYEVVVINVSDNSPWFTTLRNLQDAGRQTDGHPAPLFLCVSKTKKRPEFVLRLERMGARYVFER